MINLTLKEITEATELAKDNLTNIESKSTVNPSYTISKTNKYRWELYVKSNNKRIVQADLVLFDSTQRVLGINIKPFIDYEAMSDVELLLAYSKAFNKNKPSTYDVTLTDGCEVLVKAFNGITVKRITFPTIESLRYNLIYEIEALG